MPLPATVIINPSAPPGGTMQRKSSATPRRRSPTRRTRRNGLKEMFSAKALGEWAYPLLAGGFLGWADKHLGFWRGLNPVFKVAILFAGGVVARRKGKRELAGAAFALAGTFGADAIAKARAMLGGKAGPPAVVEGLDEDMRDAIDVLDREAAGQGVYASYDEVAGLLDDDDHLSGLLDDTDLAGFDYAEPDFAMAQ